MASVKSLGIHQPTGLQYAIDEEILPSDPSPDLYQWETVVDTCEEPPCDELLTTRNCVVWSRGGIFRKCFRFDVERETITQSLLTYFPRGGRRDGGNTQADDAAEQEPALARALVVFLKSQAHIYFLSGTSHVVHMPFEVESACAAPCGVIIQRKSRLDNLAPVTLKFPRVPPNSFVSSQLSSALPRSSQQAFSVEGLGKPRTLPLRLSSTLENMWEPPLETNDSHWPRLVCLTDPLAELGLVISQSDKVAKDRHRRMSAKSPFLDRAEEILHVETIKQHGQSSARKADDLVLAVTVNRETNMYSVWKLTYIKNGDPFTSSRRKPKSKARRRSSMQPGLNSGTTTPVHASFRESIGAQLPVKKARGGEKADRSLEKALSLEPDKSGEVIRRQSRRVSSLLARADLSASHERSAFAEQPGAGHATSSRRVESHGAQRGRASSGFVPMNMSGNYGQSLNSLLEAPVDDLLEELRAGGDFEGFTSMGLDDHEFDGLTREILLTKIHSVSMDNNNVRYSLSETPVRTQCKVFFVVGTPYAVDEPDRSYLLICIQDLLDKRLQLLPLHVQSRTKPTNNPAKTTTLIAPDGPTVTWGQLMRAQNVVDSCKISDGDHAMILILSEGEKGQRELSVQAPWSKMTPIELPMLFVDNYSSLEFSGTHVKKRSSSRRSLGIGVSGTQTNALYHSKPRGVLDIQDRDGRFHRIQIQLQPSNPRVKRALRVCRSILPASHADKILAGWWHVMQWFDKNEDEPPADLEWSSFVVLLFCMFLSLGHNEVSTLESSQPQSAQLQSDDWDLIRTYESRNAAACPTWMEGRGWQWLMDEQAGQGLVWSQPVTGGKRKDFLSLHTQFAKEFMVSPLGLAAVGPNGYLPLSLASSLERRRSLAWSLFLALHLLLEEEKLDIMVPEYPDAADLRVVLCQIARWLRWYEFVARYELGIQTAVDSGLDMELDLTPPLPEPASIPCVLSWVQAQLAGKNQEEFPTLGDVFATSQQQDVKDGPGDSRWEPITPRTFLFKKFFKLLKPTDRHYQIVEVMHKCGFTLPVLETLPEAILVPLQDAIAQSQTNPPASWPSKLLGLVNRSDINMILKPNKPPGAASLGSANPSHSANWDFRMICETIDDYNNLGYDEGEGTERQAVVRALFKDDRRLNEAQALLSSQKPRVIRLDPNPKWTESEYLEKQKELVTTLATSTLAIPAGRGMLYYSLRYPLLTQKFHIGGFNLTCVVRPTNVSVGVDKSLFSEEKVNWAFFHQGVSNGLAISPQARGIDTSWILYNKPGQDLNNRHAGFLLALGLNGHLKSVAKWVAFKYLTPKHTMTSIGLLLGLAASHIGTMDSLITRLLSVHVTRMLPRGAAELNLSHLTQTTGIMGIGLLYCNSQHRRMSEIMMSEIEFVEDEDEEDPLRNEGYRLAAGFALGLINLGKGSDLKGLHDMRITEKLLTTASSTKKVELVNVLDRSIAGATVAIALIFMKCEDHIVARKIDVPDSILQFDYVRPDILLLRTLAKNLILWSQIEPSFEWIKASLPAEYRTRYRLTGVKKLQSRDLPFFSIVAGLCFSIGMRFAGSANTNVRDLLVHFLDQFMRIVHLSADKFDAQMTRANARMCMDILALSCATVMAGTGDLVVLRRLRALHGRDDPHTTYGSHLAAHLAIGSLFLGCGTATFGTSNLAIAALLISFYPLFPADVQDNRSHLQAFRHFWVLATDPRCLVTKDMTTGQPISVPIMITLKSHPATAEAPATPAPAPRTRSSKTTAKAKGATTTRRTAAHAKTPSRAAAAEKKQQPQQHAPSSVIRRQTPCLLPPLEDIASVHTDAGNQGYWDLEVDFARDGGAMAAAFRENQSLSLRRRPAHEGAFASTLQALGRDALAGVGPDGAPGGGGEQQQQREPLDWVFGLGALADLTHTERAVVLDPAAGRGAGGAGEGSSSAVDARLVLEGAMDGSSRDELLGLRLLFEWADRRGEMVGGDGDGAGREGGTQDGGGEGAWWMRDSVIDMLKGKVWLAGQEE
ncbi:uncharacterized protein E0L32_002944 [Thyridium curvatum]|uniref:Anaphase-promoting complex subunit 1 N-terminal domain-containing protein n=1 Tax=Thyridium curvatum TaxID=1093900 RepID=A0A507BEC7_9PEZI|nr:uncharacterized protein E0L32_002944 [Thyridium curvatum]TPX17843.1 hypothetical protein E0L32_002944 [Thyridium curvatum]